MKKNTNLTGGDNISTIYINARDIRKRKYKTLMEFNSLEGLDTFTTMFKSENEMRFYFFSKDILLKDEFNISISASEVKERIGNAANPIVKGVKLVYEDFKKYLDVQFLKNKANLLFDEYSFLQELVVRYYESDSKSADIIGDYIMKKDNHTLARESLNRFIDKICLRNNKTINYEKLRDFALFIYEFEELVNEQVKKPEPKQSFEQMELPGFNDTRHR